jgi:hypothetical protein
MSRHLDRSCLSLEMLSLMKTCSLSQNYMQMLVQSFVPKFPFYPVVSLLLIKGGVTQSNHVFDSMPNHAATEVFDAENNKLMTIATEVLDAANNEPVSAAAANNEPARASVSGVQEIEATLGSLPCLSQPSIDVQGENTHISMQILETGEEKLLPEHEGSSVAAPENSQELSLSMRPHTRLQSGIRKEKVYTDEMIMYGCFTSSGEPQNLGEAVSDKNWKDAMDSEYTALMKNKTWHLVPPKKGINVIDYKWIYKIKRKSDGSLDRYKQD